MSERSVSRARGMRLELYDALERDLRLRGISRRDFLRMTAAGAIAVLIDGCQLIEQILEKIANRPVRRNLSTLPATDPVVVAYANAVTAMRALPASNKRSWDYQHSIHTNYCPHGNWLFLPWHREFVWRFEEICRALLNDNAFSLPYWNWQNSPAIPPGFLAQGTSLFHSRVRGAGATIPTFYSGPTVMEDILAETNFLYFASGALPAGRPQTSNVSKGPLEINPHDNIHVWIGGDMGSVPTSPNDPIFWMHHNMIECVWVEWNMYRGNPNTNDAAWKDYRFTEFVARDGTPAPSISPLEMTLYPLFLYRYEDPALGTPAP